MAVTLQDILKAHAALQSQTGMRMTWTTLAADSPDANRSIPLALVYNPLQSIQGLVRLRRVPFRCPNCKAIINPYCPIRGDSALFVCPLCLTSQPVPQGIIPTLATSPLPEIQPTSRTIEYTIHDYSTSHHPERVMFLIDLSVSKEELDAVKDAVLSAAAVLPETCEVGLAAYSSQLEIYEIGENRVFMFECNGKPETEAAEMKIAFGSLQAALQRFFVPMGDNLATFNECIESLEHNDLPLPREMRKARSFGGAMGVCGHLLGGDQFGGHLLCFVGGPVTTGPGSIVSLNRQDAIRGMDDITNGTANSLIVKKATAYYKSLNDIFLPVDLNAQGTSMNQAGQSGGNAAGVLDDDDEQCFKSNVAPVLFLCSPEQCGLYEMRALIHMVGGQCISLESFKQQQLVESLCTYCEALGEGNGSENKKLKLATKCLLDVQSSPGVVVTGLLGNGKPLTPRRSGHQGRRIGDNRMGVGGTDRWALSSVSSVDSLSFMFEQDGDKLTGIADGSRRFIQIRFTYYDPVANARVMRVSTVHIDIVKNGPAPGYGTPASFDSESATLLLARMSVLRADCGTLCADIIRMIDTTLVNLCKVYNTAQGGAFAPHPAFHLFPQLCYHLRRNPAVSGRGESPDALASRRLKLRICGCSDTIKYVQPPLFSYSATQTRPVPVPLDGSSMQPDKVLLMDGVDRVVVVFGSTVAKWRDEGWGEREGYENVKLLLENPVKDGGRMVLARFPAACLTISDEGTSQARFLLSRINPSKTPTEKGSGVVLTDDISLEAFINSLRTAVLEKK